MNIALFIVAAAAAAPQSEVTVIGSRVPALEQDLSASVTVLRREDFDVEKPLSLADVLRRVAGLHVDTVGGRGGTGSIYLRGADPNYTLVLLNGVRVNDPTNSRGGSFDFSALDITDVERIEIARGPYSAIYGGDALAGVINIITRSESKTSKVDIGAAAGAYDISQVSLHATLPTEYARWHLGLGEVDEGERVRGNKFQVQRVSGGVDASLGEATDLTVSGRYSEAARHGFPDDSGGFKYATLRDVESRDSREALLGAGFTHRLDGGALSLTLGYFERDESIDSPGVAPGLRDPFGVPPSVVDTNFTRYSATLSATQSLSSALSVAYGIDWQREEGASEGQLDVGGFFAPTSFELTRSSWAPFAEVRVESGIGLSAQAGARVDMPDGESSVTSPRMRVAYAMPQSLTIAASWGKAFKLPSLYALGHPLVGNPRLSPERSRSYEIELSQELWSGVARWSATWFDSEFRNAIDFDSGPPPQLVNRNRVRSRGVELAGRVRAGARWSFDASVTHARSRVTATDSELRNRPEWSAAAAVHWNPVDVLTLSAVATHVGSSFDSSIATGDVRLRGYNRVDVDAAWKFSPRFEMYVSIDNLTDEQYEQFVGFEERGIVPMAGVRVSM
ncbi:TonB-dependent receptor plug domain-containing protein [Peristeroidobacter agariperforans]|uniref:TonB-dependent receptor plug domain-containing protein n=1 Tax=Peristeroidobacter agariperforans TaxID=268404 RepID=UPI00101D7F82|nr:TonB-dependent receptor [Peristeroidobacter agariperforans]